MRRSPIEPRPASASSLRATPILLGLTSYAWLFGSALDRVRQRGGICGVVEVAIGQAAMVVISVGTASMVGGVSSAMASVCM